MSLNLISSLSFLKSKLEPPGPGQAAEGKPKVDMFGGMTASDLDTDSSDSDSDSSDSSRSSSPSFNTPDPAQEAGPTQDILRRCLEMLNNDLKKEKVKLEAPTTPEKAVVSPGKLVSSPCKVRVSSGKSLVSPSKSADYSQGLLMIATPSPGRRSRASMEAADPKALEMDLPESRSPSPGPPHLEPEAPTVRSPSPAKPAAPRPPSVVTPARTSTPLVQPALVPNITMQPSSVPNVRVQTPLQPGVVPAITTCVMSANTAQTSSAQSLNTPLQQILLPPVQSGQAQQIQLQNILQQGKNILQQPQAVFQQQHTGIQQPQTSIQLPQTIVQQPTTIVQQPTTMFGASPITTMGQQPLNIMQQPRTILVQQPQTMLQQPQTILQQPQTILQQPNGPIQIVQSGLPLQLTSSPMPLLSSSGALLGTIGGVTSNAQLLASLQQFMLVLQSGQTKLQPGLTMAGTPVMVKQEPGGLQTPVKTLQYSAPSGALSNTNILGTNQTPSGLVTCLPPQLGLAPSPAVLPTSQPSTISILPPVPSQTGTSPTMQLVQDPATGLYNLVQGGQPVPTSTPAPAPALATSLHGPLQTLCGSPKRAATPLGGSPLKVPKLLLPSLGSFKENTPICEPADSRFQCGVCNKYFGNQKNLRVHVSEIHEGKRGEFACDLCNKVFPRKRNVERHKNAVHLKTSPVCYMCHKSVVNLEMHIRRFHRGSAEIRIKLEETAPAT